ncbi:succinate-semialdehyde dehydrogenase, mitochondrial [Chrysoperla carnea]|uniref:succinate-semialdehyde dehydrogenase, mitochondrial n=1 Tax=Chrysoperla carnea TaxID=189513 RepID=UPI001D068951|nr:succinate-semialdehyde dehydrogenase, mitochondrial [Chrysoperla carnea]
MLLTIQANKSFCKFLKVNNHVRAMSLLLNKAYVNGEWISAGSGKTFQVKNPANNEVVGSVPDMDVKDAEKAINAAQEAFKTWSQTTAKERGILLRKWYELLNKHGDEIARIMTSESGKPTSEAKGEVGYGNAFVDFFSEEARRTHGDLLESPIKNRQLMIIKQPIGVVGLITPWNFPHAMITRKAAAALAVGCTCVIRPAEDTPLTALALIKTAEEAGIPKGVINVVTSDRSNAGPIGKLLCESPLVAGISFTGSTEVGKLLYRQCASGVKRIGLELGGNAPFIVFKSANLDLALQGAIASKFRNCGQTCISSNRFLIHESIFDEFLQRFKKEIKSKLVLGNPSKPGITTGPLINAAQKEKIVKFVNDARDKGAHIVIGGKPADNIGDLFYEPTIITNVKEDMLIYKEEVFGPIVTLLRFKTEEEAVRIANSTQRGLAGYFYSQDVSQIYRVSRQLETGMVGVNEGLISTAEAAFGGIKESGIGREGSHYGLDEYLYLKYICLGNLDPNPTC